MSVSMFVCYAGIASCSMQGAKKAMWSLNLAAIFIISPLLSSFGGGFVRDTSFLCVFPAVFTAESRPDILIALVAASVYLNIRECLMQRAVEWFIVLADACGMGTFIAIGVDKSIAMGANPIITLLCGVVTSLGAEFYLLCFVAFPFGKCYLQAFRIDLQPFQGR